MTQLEYFADAYIYLCGRDAASAEYIVPSCANIVPTNGSSCSTKAGVPMFQSKRKFIIVLMLACVVGVPVMAYAQEKATAPASAQVVPATTTSSSTPSVADDLSSVEKWNVHAQLTNVTQWHSRFTSPYSGPNSLTAHGRTEETTDLTLYAGLSLWRGAEVWLNPEIDQGFGLNNTVGAAGFPSGEAYKVGANSPYLRLPRLFIRQKIKLGGSEEKIEPAANQLAGSTASDHVTLTIGKFSVVDIFDTNSYAHDPRGDFLNWSILDAGAFDYAADSWGFTYGAAIEWTQDWWTLRGGYFQLSDVPNGKITSVHFSENSLVGELEERHQWQGHPGKVKLLAFVNRGRMANYGDALQLTRGTGDTPDVSLVRRFSSRPGLAINAEQELSSDLGAFVRASLNNGSKEAYEFTEINQSLSAGFSLKGDRWGRHDDSLGIAAVINRLSGAAQAYFAAGGMGILIGDGRLTYRPERIVEAYYNYHVHKTTTLAVGYQRISNPAYNADRGPVNVASLRLHTEF